MDVNSLGSTNFLNRQNADAQPNRASDNSGAATPSATSPDGASNAAAGRLAPATPTQKSAPENNTLQTNDLRSSQNNRPAAGQGDEPETTAREESDTGNRVNLKV